FHTAFRYLRDALAVANNHYYVSEIRVAQGVYKPDRDEAHPDGTGDPQTMFVTEATYMLSGGYAGFGAADPQLRDVNAFPTILSGDLNDDDLPGLVNTSDNSVRLVSGKARFDGVTIRSADLGMSD